MAQESEQAVKSTSRPRAILRFLRDVRGQAMTEYVLLSSASIALAIYLYYPDNPIFQGIRHIYNKTTLIGGWPGP